MSEPRPTKLPTEIPFEGDMPDTEFREAGHRIVDRIADYLEYGPRAPVLAAVKPGQIAARLPVAAPEEGRPIEELLDEFESVLYPGLTHWNSPRFMAYFPSVASAPGILGEMLASGFGQNAMLWRTSPAATELELRVLEWLRDLLGLPAVFRGHIVDTASISSLLALAAAREARADLQVRTRGMAGRTDLPVLTVYASEEAHSSIEKAVIALWIGQENLRKIPTDEVFRMRVDALRQAVEADRAGGRLPLAVVATVGTTSSTSIDPVPEIADVCTEHGLWLHVDAAYGGVAAIVPGHEQVLAGCERADSIVVNPHKWLFTPIDCSAFYVRDLDLLKAAFSLVPEYLTSRAGGEEVVNLMDFGVQLGRRFRALKLWLVLSRFGRRGLADRIAYHMELARELADRIREQSGVELTAPVNFATVCFRFRPEPWTEEGPDLESRLERLNTAVMEQANAGGEVFLSHTKLKGRYTLRLAIGHIRTTREDVIAVWELLTRLAGEEKARSD
jgi:aromatic-L-amino-acid decarboxylase